MLLVLVLRHIAVFLGGAYICMFWPMRKLEGTARGSEAMRGFLGFDWVLPANVSMGKPNRS